MKISCPKNGVQPPPRRARPSTQAYPLTALGVGQHFDVELGPGDDPQRVYGRIHSAVYGYRRRNGKHLRFRIVTMPGKQLVRVWRLENDDTGKLTE